MVALALPKMYLRTLYLFRVFFLLFSLYLSLSTRFSPSYHYGICRKLRTSGTCSNSLILPLLFINGTYSIAKSFTSSVEVHVRNTTDHWHPQLRFLILLLTWFPIATSKSTLEFPVFRGLFLSTTFALRQIVRYSGSGHVNGRWMGIHIRHPKIIKTIMIMSVCKRRIYKEPSQNLAAR
jgi:hypothetical protein